MFRLFEHVKSKDGHVDEQISKQTGAQVSAKDLTWSYANIFSAMKQRVKTIELINEKFGKSIIQELL
jgi:GH15 family glucan-1,4-alpha-glucosidase